MKLAFFSFSDSQGGAAKATYSIYRSVKTSFTKCHFLSIHKKYNKSTKAVCNLHFLYLCFLRGLEKVIIYFYFKSNFHQSLNIFKSFNLSKINNHNYDIVNLHWINRCSISLQEILLIKTRVVISLHDMWFLSRTSHYFEKNPNINGRIDAYIGDLKQKIYNKSNIFFIAHSRWMYNHIVKKISNSTRVFLCKYYPINTNLFKPRNKISLKKKFNIKTDKIIILFSAHSIIDPRKGESYFYKLVKYFSNHEKFHFVIVGGGGFDTKFKEFNNCSLFPLLDHEQMAEVYSLADIYICTSILDNLPLTILEALSSGLLVITFDNGGAKEVIGNYGYTVPNKNYKSIILILSKLTRQSIARKSKKARNFAVKNLSSRKIKNNYLKIINRINKINVH